MSLSPSTIRRMSKRFPDRLMTPIERASQVRKATRHRSSMVGPNKFRLSNQPAGRRRQPGPSVPSPRGEALSSVGSANAALLRDGRDDQRRYTFIQEPLHDARLGRTKPVFSVTRVGGHPTMRRIVQKDEIGCGIACVAMLTGQSYAATQTVDVSEWSGRSHQDAGCSDVA